MSKEKARIKGVSFLSIIIIFNLIMINVNSSVFNNL